MVYYFFLLIGSLEVFVLQKQQTHGSLKDQTFRAFNDNNKHSKQMLFLTIADFFACFAVFYLNFLDLFCFTNLIVYFYVLKRCPYVRSL